MAENFNSICRRGTVDVNRKVAGKSLTMLMRAGALIREPRYLVFAGKIRVVANGAAMLLRQCAPTVEACFIARLCRWRGRRKFCDRVRKQLHIAVADSLHYLNHGGAVASFAAKQK